MPAPESSLDWITRLIRSRRSVKPFDMDADRPVSRALISSLLDNANWAPTHGLTQPWRFQVFQDASRHELAAVMQDIYRTTTPPAEFREEKLRKMSQNPLLAPVVIACCMERGGVSKIPELEEIEATACAAQNFFLSAHAAGLAAYWSSPPLIYTPAFTTWLGLAEGARCLGLFYLGWPKAEWRPAAGTREALDAKVRWR